jgi:MFS family permease
MQVGLFLFAVAFFVFLMTMRQASLSMVVIFMVLVATANSCLGPVSTAWLMNRTPPSHRGMVSGMYQTLNIVSTMSGVCLFETLYSISHDLMFGCHFVCMFGMCFCIAVFWTVFGRSPVWAEATDFAG